MTRPPILDEPKYTEILKYVLEEKCSSKIVDLMIKKYDTFKTKNQVYNLISNINLESKRDKKRSYYPFIRYKTKSKHISYYQIEYFEIIKFISETYLKSKQGEKYYNNSLIKHLLQIHFRKVFGKKILPSLNVLLEEFINSIGYNELDYLTQLDRFPIHKRKDKLITLFEEKYPNKDLFLPTSDYGLFKRECLFYVLGKIKTKYTTLFDMYGV